MYPFQDFVDMKIEVENDITAASEAFELLGFRVEIYRNARKGDFEAIFGKIKYLARQAKNDR